MKDVLIACKMMEAEVEKALEATGSEAIVLWLDKELHNVPEKLREVLQETMDDAERTHAPDRILLAFGFCGNAVQGLRAGKYQLIMPRIDDCITMLIGSRRRKAELESGVGTMFLTQNWVGSDNDLVSVRNHLFEEYDEDEAEELFDMMYGHYGRIGVLDTKCYPLEPMLVKSQAMAEAMGFEHKIFDASNSYLVRLLTGPWGEEEFIVKEPGETIFGRDLRI